MAEGNLEQWLIIEPAPTADERFSALLPALARLGLDAYSARQRLVGQAPALLARGRGEKMAETAELLASHRFPHWLITPTPPRFTPERILAVHCGDDRIRFAGRAGEIVFARQTPIVAILADLSGKMPEKQMRRLLAQNTYRGADHLQLAGDEEIFREILRAEPVLDLYRLSVDGLPEQGVRVFPGRFDPKGLGKKMSYSAVGNLEAVLHLVREQCPTRLHTGFGLAALPGCRPQGGAPGVDSRRANLVALTRFGWLMLDLERARAEAAKTAAEPWKEALPIGRVPLFAAAAALAPALSTVGISGTGISPPATEAAQEAVAKSGVRAAGLPAPPEGLQDSGDRRRQIMLWQTTGVAIACSLIFAGGEDLRVLVWHGGVRTGILPGCLSLLLFLGGAQALRWKRCIENTPTSRVRSLAMGLVEVHGRATRQYALVSPMTHLACVWYRLRRYRRVRNGWRLSSTRTSGAIPFLLDDGTGKIQIEPAGARIRGGSSQEGYENGGSFLSARGGGPDEKWVEEVIAEGTYLYILGYARDQRRQGPSLAERTREKLRLLKGNAPAFRRFDANNDGRIDAEEWEMARSAMEAEAIRDQLAEGRRRRRQEEHAAIGRPPGRSLPFIIAETESEARLLGRYGRLAAAMLMGGLLLAAWAAAIILPRFVF